VGVCCWGIVHCVDKQDLKKIMVFWDVMQRSVVDRCQHFMYQETIILLCECLILLRPLNLLHLECTFFMYLLCDFTNLLCH
jgi:hypothetical protein